MSISRSVIYCLVFVLFACSESDSEEKNLSNSGYSINSFQKIVEQCISDGKLSEAGCECQADLLLSHMGKDDFAIYAETQEVFRKAMAQVKENGGDMNDVLKKG